MTGRRPPRAFRFVLERLLGRGPGGPPALADLDQEFGDRARTDPAAARRWYRREAWSVAMHARQIAGRPGAALQRGDPMIRRLFTDLRLSVRSLAKQPRFTLVAVLTLALGIGAVTAIFSVVNGVLLQPLPYPNAARLVNIWSMSPGLGYDQFPLSPDLFKYFREHNTSFEDMALWQPRRANLSQTEGPEVVNSAVTTSNYFATLGVTFVAGRSYTAEEDTPKGARVAVMSHRLWQRAFGGDPGVVNRLLRIDGAPTAIVGIAPAWMDRAETPDLWFPTRFGPDGYPAGTFGWNAVGRLKAGVLPDDAAAQLQPLVAQAMSLITSPNYRAFLTDGRYRLLVHPMKQDVIGDAETPLWLLLGTVGIVLLIACANVANLCLIRAEARQREIGVRLALGAGRGALVRSLLVEALVLASLGAAGGLLVASLALPLMTKLAPSSIPRLDEVRIDGVVLAGAALLAGLAAVVVGLVPALRYTRPSMLGSLRHGGRSATDNPSRQRGRSVLVAAQTAMAMVLLVGSGLLGRSFVKMMNVDPGFDPNDLMTARIALPASTYPKTEDVARTARAIVEQLAAIPGVTGAGATARLPITQSTSGTAFTIEGRPIEAGKLPPILQYQEITPGYFAAMRARFDRGRDFDWHDTSSLIVNRVAASQLWPGQDPLGKRVRRARSEHPDDAPWLTVVGMVGDIRQDGLREPAPAMFYFPVTSGFDDAPRVLTYVARGPAAMTSAEGIRRAVRSVDADLPLASVQTVRQVIRESVIDFSFTMLALAIAAGVALVLGTVGLYSVLSYAVSLRTKEIGVRLALGAPRAAVMRAIVLRGTAICGLGLVVGGLGAFGLTRLLGGLLFETAALDPLTFAATAAGLLIVAVAASYLPARRAAGISPMESMRSI